MRITKKKSFVFITIIMGIFLLVGCGNKNASNGKGEADNSSKTSESNEASPSGNSKDLPIATIKVEGFGEIQAELYPEIAPNTVNNFIYLANKGFITI